jgi:hypothetical protein
MTREEPWIETKEGGFFFVNSLLIFPYMMLLLPLLTRLFVRGVVGGLAEPSQIVDTFPTLTEFLAPRYGWLAVVPLVLVWKNLGIEHRSGPRLFLWIFGVAHLTALVWTVTGWFGVHDFGLPGGP